MSTGNPAFNHQNDLWVDNLISKSTQISRTAEKIKNQLFKVLLKQVDELALIVEA